MLHGCETWSLTLREEHRLRVFENRMLRKIFGPNREEDGSWRKYHNDDILHLILFFFFSWLLRSLRTLAFLNGLLDPQTFGRTPWLGDQTNARPLQTHRTTQHRNTQTHIHAPSRIRTCDLNVQAVVDSTCLRPLCY
jgi:hypothetical protein